MNFLIKIECMRLEGLVLLHLTTLDNHKKYPPIFENNYEDLMGLREYPEEKLI